MRIQDFRLSKHAVERLVERNEKFAKSLTAPYQATSAAYRYIADAVEERSFLNDTRFMVMVHERYGFDKQYAMFVKDNSIFVGIVEPDVCTIVTVLNRNEHQVTHFKTRRSFKDVQKKSNNIKSLSECNIKDFNRMKTLMKL